MIENSRGNRAKVWRADGFICLLVNDGVTTATISLTEGEAETLANELDPVQRQLGDSFNALAVGHALEKHRLQDGNERIGKWLSAALDDPAVCSDMKADIRAWFDGQKPRVPDKHEMK